MFIRAKDLFDPSVNVCSGVRWLFRKQITASSRLKRKATWEEAIIEYKAYWKIIDAGQIPKAIVELREYYNNLLNKLRNENISPDVRKRMIYYLRRDLLMFPYTYDKERIDTFSAKNSMEVTS
jgi:hypothetical protein